VLSHSSVSIGRCSSHFQDPELAVSANLTQVTWVVGQTAPVYCLYLPVCETGTKLYCLVTEARVCEQLVQGCYLAVHRAGIKLGTSGLPIWHATLSTEKEHKNPSFYMSLSRDGRNWYTSFQCKCLYHQMSEILSKCQISYVKWLAWWVNLSNYTFMKLGNIKVDFQLKFSISMLFVHT